MRFRLKRSLSVILAVCMWVNIAFSMGIPSVALASDQVTITGGGNGTGGTIPAGNSMSGVAYGNNVYVMVGYYGMILKSTDGLNWSMVKDSTFQNTHYTEVAFGNGIFVAIGPEGVIVTSSDGTVWTKQTSNTTNALNDVQFINGKFYVVGQNGTVLTSANGVTWMPMVIPMAVGYSLMNIAYGNGVYVIGGRDASGNGSYVFYSIDGMLLWIPVTVALYGTTLNEITFLKDKFYVFTSDAKVFTSPTAASWSAVTDSRITGTTQIFHGFYDGTKTYLFGSTPEYQYGSVFTSTDGNTFTLQAQSAYIVAQNSAYLNGKYFQVGNEGFVVSDDGVNWRFTASAYMGIATNGTNYVMVGGITNGAQMFSSTDFQNWTNNTASFIKPVLNAVTYGGGKYVAVGNGESAISSSIFATSSNGTSWTTGVTGFVDNLRAVAYGNGKYVAVGLNGRILSYDGTTWSDRGTVTTGVHFYGVSYVNNLFIAVGGGVANGSKVVVKYSANGESWTDVSPDIVGQFHGVAYGGGKYVLVGRDNTAGSQKFFSVATSDITTAAGYSSAGTVSSVELGSTFGGVAYGNNTFVAITNTKVSPITHILTSTDGTTWTATSANHAGLPRSIIFDGTKFRVVGIRDGKMTVMAGSATPTASPTPAPTASPTPVPTASPTPTPSTQTMMFTLGDNDSIIGTTLMKTLGGKAFTCRADDFLMVYDDADNGSGIYAYTGTDSNVDFSVTIQSGYIFDLEGFDYTADLNAGVNSINVQYASNGVPYNDTYPVTKTINQGAKTLTSLTNPAIGISKVNFRASGHAVFQNLKIKNIRPVPSTTPAPPAITGAKILHTLNEIEITSNEFYGIVPGDFKITDNTNPVSVLTVTGMSAYQNGKYKLTLSGPVSYYDTYTLTLKASVWNNTQFYQNTNLFYGILATSGDLDLVNEPNIFDTYSRTLWGGIVKVENGTYATDALIYPNNLPSSLYTKLETNNGDATTPAITDDWRAAGAFVIAPEGTKGVKSLFSTGVMTQMTDGDLIDTNPNFKETVASGKAANNNDYWKTIAFMPVYMKAAVKQADGAWRLNDPSDRLRIIEFYDNELCTGSPIKVVRFMMTVDYTGSTVIVPPAPTLPVHNDTANTFGWTNALSYTSPSDYEYSTDGGSHWQAVTANPQSLPNGDFAIGAIQVRVKADNAAGRATGAALSSTAAYTLNPPDSSISPQSASFDAYYPNRTDVSVALNLVGGTFTGISNNGTALQKDVDYTHTGNNVTILKSYLVKQPIGTTNLTFQFSVGNPVVLQVAVGDTTPTEVTANNSEALGVYVAHPNVSVVHLVSGTTYTYEGGTVSKNLIIDGKQAFITTGAGTTDHIVRSNVLSDYVGKVLFKVENGSLTIKDVILKNDGHRIRSVFNVKTGGVLNIENVIFKDFYNSLDATAEDINNNTNNFGIHSEPGAISLQVTRCIFDASNAFRNTIAVRGGTAAILNNTFTGTSYPERLNHADGYEYAIYLYGGNSLILANTISGFDSTRQAGWVSSGIAAVPYYATVAQIDSNNISGCSNGIDMSGMWKAYFPPEATLTLNGTLVNTSDNGFRAGEKLLKNNQLSNNVQSNIHLLLDQDDPEESAVYEANMIENVDGLNDRASVVFFNKQIVQKILSTSLTRAVELSSDNGLSWQTATLVGSFNADAASVTVSLQPNVPYLIRLKLTHSDLKETPSIITGYSEAIYLKNALPPIITNMPNSQTVKVNALASLSVAATGTGSLSYQWYRNTANSTQGATLIVGATNATYQAPTDSIGTTYYYCTVTNTDPNATGDQKAVSNTSIAAVTVERIVLTVNSLTLAQKIYDGQTNVGIVGGSLNGVVNSDDVSLSVAAATAAFDSASAGIDKNVNVNGLSLSGSAAWKYSLAANSTTKGTILPKPIAVTATAASKIYGQNDPAFTYVISENLVGTDTLSGQLSRQSGETQGTYGITQGSLVNSNYQITFVPANFVIHKRPITVTATAASKIYGQNDPTFTYVISENLVGTDTLAGQLSRQSGEAQGIYSITQGTVENSNYLITFVPANFVINKRPITVKADDKQKTHGEADPALTYQITSGNLVNGDQFTGELSRVVGDIDGSTAKEFDIIQNTLALSGNYELTYEKGILTIVPSTQCDLTTVVKPQEANVNGLNIQKTVPYADGTAEIAIEHSAFASWKLYSDEACTQEFDEKIMTLNVGNNVAYIKVTAQDATTSKVYTITVRRKSNNANLKSLVPNSGELSPVFNKDTVGYTTILKGNVNNYTVNPTVEDTGNATVTVNGQTVESGQASQVITTALGSGNQVSVVVTAENGNQKEYTIQATKYSGNANLNSLKSSEGTLSPSFSENTTSYTIDVANTVTKTNIIPAVAETGKATVKVNGYELSNVKTSLPITLNEGVNVVNVVVTAEDGTQKTYTITINRALAPNAKSNNANLLDIIPSVGKLSPVFNKTTTGYEIAVASDVAKITVKPVLEDSAKAGVKVNGTNVSSGTDSQDIGLNEGENTITLEVTSESGNTKTYTVKVRKAAPLASNNAVLTNLSIGQWSLNTGFDKNITLYTASVGMDIMNLNVTPTAEDTKATVFVNNTKVQSGSPAVVPLKVGSNTIITRVVAEDGTVKEYTLIVTRYSNRLINLELSNCTLSPSFVRDELVYAATVENSVHSITVTPTLERPLATVKVNGEDVADRTASTSIALNEGENTIIVTVTAEDQTQKTYKVIVVRKKAAQDAPDPAVDVIKKVVDSISADPSPEELIAAKSVIENAVELYEKLPSTQQAYITKEEKDNLYSAYEKLKSALAYEQVRSTSTYYVEATQGFITNLENALSADDGEKLTIKLNVEKVTAPQKTTASGQMVGDTFDITISEVVTRTSDNSVLASNDNVQPKTGETVTIKIKVPTHLVSKRGLGIVYVKPDGTLVEQSARIVTEGSSTYLVFEAQHFSQYAIAYILDPVSSGGGWSSSPSAPKHEAYVVGYPDNSFKPNNSVTRAEVVTILSRLSTGYNANDFYVNNFNDVEANVWYSNPLGFMQSKSIITGYTDGSFMPNGSMTRAEFAAAIAKFAGIQGVDGDTAFSDANGHWAQKYILALVQKGYIKGYEDGTFKPNAAITRAEAVKIMNAVIGRTAEVSLVKEHANDYPVKLNDISGHWAYYDIIEATTRHNVKDFHK